MDRYLDRYRLSGPLIDSYELRLIDALIKY
jgi:hypothetical protein